MSDDDQIVDPVDPIDEEELIVGAKLPLDADDDVLETDADDDLIDDDDDVGLGASDM